MRCARIASQIPGKDVKALESVLNARETLLKLIEQVEKHSPPQKEKILQALNSRGVMCHDLLDSLQEYLIEHRHESPVLQQEYDRNFAISACII